MPSGGWAILHLPMLGEGISWPEGKAGEQGSPALPQTPRPTPCIGRAGEAKAFRLVLFRPGLGFGQHGKEQVIPALAAA